MKIYSEIQGEYIVSMAICHTPDFSLTHTNPHQKLQNICMLCKNAIKPTHTHTLQLTLVNNLERKRETSFIGFSSLFIIIIIICLFACLLVCLTVCLAGWLLDYPSLFVLHHFTRSMYLSICIHLFIGMKTQLYTTIFIRISTLASFTEGSTSIQAADMTTQQKIYIVNGEI